MYKAFLKKITFLLPIFIMLCSQLGTGQGLKITGTVVDSTGTPLQMANVIAYQQDKNPGGFGITNQNGRFQVTGLVKDSTYVVNVSYLGLEPVTDTIRNMQQDLVKNYMLFQEENSLDEIEITYKIPVTVRGDTIIYNADSFTNGTERKLGDILRKLPGVEVNEDGDIQVEGKTVERVKVEGKDFFEGDSRLASKNIPADAVDKVEVLRNYNDQQQLKGLGNDQDRVAINIRLKEGKKRFWFGEATAAGGFGGDEFRYLARPKAFYYSPDFSFSALTDFNNLGEVAFTARDYFRFTGGFGRNTRRPGSTFNLGDGIGNLLGLQNNRANEIESQFGAFNLSWSASKTLDVSGYGIYSRSEINLLEQSRRTFIEQGFEERTDRSDDQVTDQGLFKLGLDYNPSDAFTVDYNAFAKANNLDQSTDLISDRVDATEFIETTDEQRQFTVDQTLNLYYTAAEDHIFASESQVVIQNQDPFYQAIRDQEPFPGPGGLGLQDEERFNINQDKLVRSTQVQSKLDYWWVLNKKSNINFTVGGNVTGQNFDSNIFQILDNGSRDDLEEERLNNDVHFRYTDAYAGVHYKFITGKFTITPGFNAHMFWTRDEQNGITNTMDFQRILPDFNVRYDFRSSETLRFDYRQTVSFADVESYARGIVFNNYNSLFQGNNQLEGAINDEFSLNYSNFDMFNYTNIFASLTYSQQREALQNTALIDGINQISTPINSALANDVVNLNGRYSREFGKIQAGLNVNASYSSFNNIINGQSQESVSFNQTYGVTARSNFQEGVNFDLGYTFGIRDNDNGRVENTFYDHRLNLTADWQITEDWFFKADYDYTLYTGTGGIENDFQFLETALYYQEKGSSWEFKLAATNLLDAQSINTDTFGQIVTTTREYFVQPRFIYLQVMYEF